MVCRFVGKAGTGLARNCRIGFGGLCRIGEAGGLTPAEEAEEVSSLTS